MDGRDAREDVLHFVLKVWLLRDGNVDHSAFRLFSRAESLQKPQTSMSEVGREFYYILLGNQFYSNDNIRDLNNTMMS